MEQLLQTVGGILVTICLGLVSWCLKQVIDLKERVSTNEAKDEMRHQENERRFNELREENVRLRKDQLELNRQLVTDVKDTNRFVRELGDKLTSVQEDIAVLKAQNNAG